LLSLVASLVLSACAPLIRPVTTVGSPPTPVVSVEKGGVDDPNVFVDPAAFRAALLQGLGPGFNVSVDPVLDIDGEQAIVVNGLPGQDSNRQLFMVHGDLLYHMMFVPDNPRLDDPYHYMEDLYAMIINTFHFTK
jgi:hypothetical protein